MPKLSERSTASTTPVATWIASLVVSTTRTSAYDAPASVAASSAAEMMSFTEDLPAGGECECREGKAIA